MRREHRRPKNHGDFEILCLKLLRHHWNRTTLQLYAKGEKQHGIDILDLSGDASPLAAQAKLREAGKRLKPSEIEQEVEAAKTFDPPLRRYCILTTASRSKAAQDKVGEVNRDHRQAGLFLVEILFWEEIEELLDRYPDVQEEMERPGALAPASAIVPELGEVLGKIETAVSGPSADAVDAEIDEAKELVRKGETKTARHLLERIRQRQWARLSDWQKFRVLSNLGASSFEEDDFSTAARLYREAKPWQPDHEVALANEALAFLLEGDSTTALDLISPLRDKFPHSARIWSIWANSAPVDVSAEQLEAQVPQHLIATGEVALPLAFRALVAGDFERAERLARAAVEKMPEHPPALLSLARAVVRRELAKWDPGASNTLPTLDDSAAREATDLLDRAIRTAGTRRMSRVLVEALLERAKLRRLLGDIPGWQQDVVEAKSTGPRDPNVAIGYAELLQSSGKIDEAIQVLREAGTRETKPLLAVALKERGQPEDLGEASALFAKLAIQRPLAEPEHRELTVALALECLEILGRWQEAHAFLDALPAAIVSDSALAAMQGRAHLKQGDRDNASRFADRALALQTTKSDRRRAAQLLSDLGRHEDAYPLWRDLWVPGQWGPDGQRLLHCVSRLGHDEESLEICKKLREAGVEDRSVLEYEIHLLERYDVNEAIRLLLERINQHPEDGLSRLRLALIGVKLDRQELLVDQLDRLPPVGDVSPEAGRAVVQVLQFGGRPNQALEYAYELLRRHFSNPEAHLAFMGVLLPTGPAPDVPEIEVVGPGSAVLYSEDGDERWTIMEDSLNPEMSRDEHGPDHALCQHLLGKKVGESFTVAEGTLHNRIGVIKQIVSKYRFRYQDCMDQWQIRFPSIPAVESVRVLRMVAGKEEFDLSALQKSVELKHDRVETLLAAYATSPISVHLLGQRLGLSVFQALSGLASDPRITIRCCEGSAEDRASATASLNSAVAVVLEATAITTLANLKLTSLLQNLPCQVMVSQATLNELRALMAEESAFPGERGTLCKGSSGFVLYEDTPKARDERIQRMRDLVLFLESHCQIEAGHRLAALAPEKRDILTKAFGQHGAESILLAVGPGRVLWTDDWVVAGLAKAEFGAARVWTQVMLEWGTGFGTIDAAAMAEASAKLVGWGYYFTGINDLTMVKAGLLAKWSPDDWPLKQVLDLLRNTSVDPIHACALAANFLAKLYVELYLPELRQAVHLRLLECLLARTDALVAIKTLKQLLPRAFGLNLPGLHEAAQLTIVWHRSRGLP